MSQVGVAPLDIVAIDRPTAPGRFVAGAALTGLVAAFAFPERGPGLGILLIAVVAAAVIIFTAKVTIDRYMALFGASALAVSFSVVFHASEWLGLLDLLVICGLASLANAGPGDLGWAGVLAGSFGVIPRLFLSPLFLLRSILGARKPMRYMGFLRGMLLGSALLIVFGVLFAAADGVFRNALASLIPTIDFGLFPRLVIFGAATAFVTALAMLHPAYKPERAAIGLDGSRRLRTLSRSDWVVAGLMLNALFAIFGIFQIAALFGGDRHVLNTANLTYAQYARQGFMQLIIAAILTVAVVAAAVRWCRVESGSEDKDLKAILGMLCALTLVVLASALKRLYLYERAFGLTRPRVSAFAVISAVGGILVLLIASGIVRRKKWLPIVTVCWLTGLMLAFNLLAPDRLIARYNVDRFLRTGQIDTDYLAGLSADAVPELIRLPMHLRACSLAPIVEDLQTPDPWNSFNLSRHLARRVLAANHLDLAAVISEACPESYPFGD